MPRKKRITLIITMLVIVILAITITMILLYLNTDMFKSSQTLFFKYVGQNTENIETIEKIFEKTEYDSLLQMSKYVENSEVKVNYTKNLGTTSENTSNNINQLKLTVEGQVDKTNQYDYKDIKLLKSDNQLFELQTIQNDNNYGIRFSDLFKQYILAENNNLKDLFEKMGYTEEQIGNIPDNIAMNKDMVSSLQFNKEEIESLKEKYLGLIGQSFSKENFTKQTKQIISIDEKRIQVNAYILNMTKEQLNSMYLKVLENLKQDEVILEKLDYLQSKIIQLDASNQIQIKEEFVKEIEATIEGINRNNIGNEETKMIVYESEGETVRTTIQGVDYELNFDCLQIDEEKFAKISVMEKEIETNKIVLKSREGEVSLSVAKNQNNKPITIAFKQNRKMGNGDCTKNIVIQYEDENNRVETNIVRNVKLVDQFENQVTLNNENSIQLDTMESKQVQAIVNRVKEELQKKWESISQEVVIEDIQEVLKTIGFVQDIQKLEGNGVSETEKNRFNSKFELLQGEKLSSENVLKVIDTIQNNFVDMQVISNEELKLEISKNQNNKEMAEILKKFIEKDTNRKYNIKVEYEESGLVKYLILTIVREQR